MTKSPAFRVLSVTALMAACGLFAAQDSRAQAGMSPAESAQPAAASASTALPPWDISTVKPASPDARGSMLNFTDDGIKITNVPLQMVVREAFGLNDDRLIGGPNWGKLGNFDIEAKVAPEDVPKLKAIKYPQRRPMLVSLLEERFGLKYHHETRELPMYELVMAACAGEMIAAQTVSPPLPPIPESAQSAAATANASDALPAFDVVSIKTHKDEGMMMRMGISATPDGFQADGVSLQMLVRQAFGLSDDRILNEPDWVKSARFDINAKVAPEDAPKLKALSGQQRFAMLLPVLEDRFGLKFHHETKDLQAYTLVVARGGPRLKESAPTAGGPGTLQPQPGPDGAWLNGHPPPPPPPSGASGAPGGPASRPGAAAGPPPGAPMTMMRMSPQGMSLESRRATMASLAQLLSQQMGATVVDKTGLTGKYDFTLSFTPDNFMINGHPPGGGAGPDGGAQSQEPVGPSIFTAVQEQLGLKLVAEKQAVDVVVIDHIEQPTAN